MAPEHWDDDSRIDTVLDEGKLLFLAVAGRRGPHVTPVAFDRRGRRLWSVAPRGSVKVAAIRGDHRVGGLITAGERAVMLCGRARVIDPLAAPGGLFPLGVDRLLDLPPAFVGYAVRNRRHVSGAIRDDPSPALALTRAALCIDITRIALLEGDRVRAAWGDWDNRPAMLAGALPATPPDLSDLPPEVRRYLSLDADSAVLGWGTPAGPIALPASWHAQGWAQVPAAAMRLAGVLSAGPACLTVQRSAHRLRSKRGVMLSGTGHARSDGVTAQVTIDQNRLTWWAGQDSGTVRSSTGRIVASKGCPT